MEIIASLAPMLIVFVVFYLVLLLPEKKRKKQYMQMLDNLQVNDEIMTRGGIISLDGENMVIESGPDRARLKMTKNAIANKIYKED